MQTYSGHIQLPFFYIRAKQCGKDKNNAVDKHKNMN